MFLKFRKYKYLYLILVSISCLIYQSIHSINNQVKPIDNTIFSNDEIDTGNGNAINFNDNKIYSIINSKYGIKFLDYSLSKKCEIYFNLLYEISPNWKLSPKIGQSEYPHDSKEIYNDLHYMNIYNDCFLKKSLPNDKSKNLKSYKNLAKKFNDLDYRIYPYLSRKLPIFVRWDGTKIIGPPKQSVKNSIKTDEVEKDADQLSTLNMEKNSFQSIEIPFWEFYRSKTNGKGIVVSTSDKFINFTIKLIKNLRALENTLPIEVIHRGDLSVENQLELVRIGRTIKGINYNEEMFNDIKNSKIYSKKFNFRFPKQDIWFVDVSSSINSEYNDKFQKYFNKFLSYLFNSFEEFVMLDCDVVLFKKVSDFFKTSQYLKSGSLFFKDRNLDMHMSDQFLNFLKNVSPSKSDELLFQRDPINDEFWDSEYFENNYFHYMESGLLLINKNKYWTGMLLSAHLSFIQPTITGSWGDKEHYWMGLLLSGYDDFQFDNYWTGSVGDYSKNRLSLKSKEICSTHPAHILSDDNKLAWVNSGILNCEYFDEKVLETDFNKMSEINNEILNLKDLKSLYNKPISLKHAIIPPLSKYNIKNDNDYGDEPLVAYNPNGCCNGYMWCAHDRIGNGGEKVLNGISIDFNQNDIEFYNYIADLYAR